MASSSSRPALSAAILVMAVMAALTWASTASYYKVGDADGWHVPGEDEDAGMYETWANQYSLYVGDSLIFEYKNDSVVRVGKRGYYHCNETGGRAKYEDGKTVFLLDKPGFHYFSSGDVGHCRSGQRLMIEASEDSSHDAPPYPAAPSPAPMPSAAVSSWDAASFSVLLMTAFGAAALMAFDSSLA